MARAAPGPRLSIAHWALIVSVLTSLIQFGISNAMRYDERIRALENKSASTDTVADQVSKLVTDMGDVKLSVARIEERMGTVARR